MKEGWEIKTLDEITSIKRGLTYSRKDTVDISKNIVLRATNISLDKSSLDFQELKYLREDFEIKDDYKLKLGSLLICFSSGSKSHLGKVALVEENYSMAFGGFIGQITPNKIVLSKYLFYNLISENYKKYISKLTDGVNINNLKSKDLKSFSIPVPPLSEQQQIVSILDKAFAAIDQVKANVEQNIENAKELFQSKLNEIFNQKGEGWEEKVLGEVVLYDKSKYIEEDRPYVGLENIESNSGKYLGNLEPKKVKSSTFQFDQRHVLYGRLRPYLNKVLVPNFKGHCSTEIFPILPTDNLERKFLFYWLMSPKTVAKINATWTGARMPRANMNEVIKFKFRMPAIKIQIEIVNNLTLLNNKCKKLESKYKQKLENLEELKKSILQKAFAGELTSPNGTAVAKDGSIPSVAAVTKQNPERVV